MHPSDLEMRCKIPAFANLAILGWGGIFSNASLLLAVYCHSLSEYLLEFYVCAVTPKFDLI